MKCQDRKAEKTAGVSPDGFQAFFLKTIHLFLISEYPSDAQNLPVAGIGNLYAGRRRGSMDDLAASDVNAHMAGIAQDISWLGFRKAGHR